MKNFDQFLNENKWDPFKAITYLVEIEVVFDKWFDPTNLKFKLLIPHYEDQNDNTFKKYIDKILEVFTNIHSYNVIKIEEAKGNDRILPMY